MITSSNNIYRAAGRRATPGRAGHAVGGKRGREEDSARRAEQQPAAAAAAATSKRARTEPRIPPCGWIRMYDGGAAASGSDGRRMAVFDEDEVMDWSAVGKPAALMGGLQMDLDQDVLTTYVMISFAYSLQMVD